MEQFFISLDVDTRHDVDEHTLSQKLIFIIYQYVKILWEWRQNVLQKLYLPGTYFLAIVYTAKCLFCIRTYLKKERCASCRLLSQKDINLLRELLMELCSINRLRPKYTLWLYCVLISFLASIWIADFNHSNS